MVSLAFPPAGSNGVRLRESRHRGNRAVIPPMHESRADGEVKVDGLKAQRKASGHGTSATPPTPGLIMNMRVMILIVYLYYLLS